MSANGHHPDEAPTNGRAGSVTNGHVESALVEPGPQRTRRFMRRGPARAQADEGGNDPAGLAAELMLLREDNARLAQEQHQPPRVAGLLRRAGGRTADAASADDPGDELAQLLTDYSVMRETLLVACDEMENALAGLRARLTALPAAGSEPGGDDVEPATEGLGAAAPGPGAVASSSR